MVVVLDVVRMLMMKRRRRDVLVDDSFVGKRKNVILFFRLLCL